MKFDVVRTEPKVGNLILNGNDLCLCIGYEEVNIKLYPLFISYPNYFHRDDDCTDYYEKVIRNAINFLLSTTLAPNFILTKEIASVDIIRYKTKQKGVLNPDTFYATKEELALWYMKCRLSHPELPNLHYDLDSYLEEKRKSYYQCPLTGNQVLSQLGIYRTSATKCIIYLGYHKDLDTYFYWHTRINNLSSDAFFKRAKLRKNNTFDRCNFTSCEHIGDMLDTDELREFLKVRGLNLCNIVR